MGIEQTSESRAQAVSAWEECLSIIRDNMNSVLFKTWFQPIKAVALDINPDDQTRTLTIQVSSHFFYTEIEQRFAGVLKSSLHRVLGTGAKLQYEVIMENSSSDTEPYTVSLPSKGTVRQGATPQSGFGASGGIPNPFVIPGLQKVAIDPHLHPFYTFDSFIEGEHNRLARTAGIAVASQPGKTAFNPLFIHGGVGLGKTHLIHAIGNEIRKQHPHKAVLYVSSEKFTTQFTDSVKHNSISDFINFYQSLDVLIVDDVQFLSTKEKTQDIFFHVFNHLHQHGKQLILTSDTPPGDLKNMEDRLLSRFKWGLNAELQRPEYPTRIAILRYKMAQEGIEIGDPVTEYIAQHISSNVRELEGAMIGILAHSSFNKRDIDLDLARMVVKNFVKNSNREVSIDNIQKIVCDYFSLGVEKLKEKTRKREIVQARQISMYFAKKYTKSSLKTIGQHFGNRDHSTVIHALNTVSDLMSSDRVFKRYVEDINKKIEVHNA
jgi:chromosomal replication initiator protein